MLLLCVLAYFVLSWAWAVLWWVLGWVFGWSASPGDEAFVASSSTMPDVAVDEELDEFGGFDEFGDEF